MSDSGEISVPTHVRVRGVSYALPTTLTLEEAIEVQDIANVPVLSIGSYLAKGDPEAILAVVYIAMKQQNPYTQLATVEGLAIEEIELA